MTTLSWLNGVRFCFVGRQTKDGKNITTSTDDLTRKSKLLVYSFSQVRLRYWLCFYFQILQWIVNVVGLLLSRRPCCTSAFVGFPGCRRKHGCPSNTNRCVGCSPDPAGRFAWTLRPSTKLICQWDDCSCRAAQASRSTVAEEVGWFCGWCSICSRMWCKIMTLLIFLFITIATFSSGAEVLLHVSKFYCTS